jgi:hypothetical protein
MKGAFPCLVHWARHASRRNFCPALAAQVSPEQNIFSPRPTLFHFICPHHPASWQAVVPGSLSLTFVSVHVCTQRVKATFLKS